MWRAPALNEVEGASPAKVSVPHAWGQPRSAVRRARSAESFPADQSANMKKALSHRDEASKSKLVPAYTLNEEPQPQVLFTLGFSNLKPAPSSVST